MPQSRTTMLRYTHYLLLVFMVSFSAAAMPVPLASSSPNCDGIFAHDVSHYVDVGLLQSLALDSSIPTADRDLAQKLVIDAQNGKTADELAQDVAGAPLSNAMSTPAEYDLKELRESFIQIEKLSQNLNLQPAEPLLSIVIPAYKEAARLPGSLIKIQEFLKTYPLNLEVLVIVETSPDHTIEAAKAVLAPGENRIHVIDNKDKKGKGYAVRSGMKRATGRYTLFMDADLSTPMPEVLKFLETMMKHPETDILIGSRNNPDSDYFQNRDLRRRIMSAVFIDLVQRVLRLPGLTDTQAGFKMFKTSASKDIFQYQEINGFSFDLETLVLAQRLHHPVAEQPIHWADAKGSTVNPLWDPLKMLLDIFKVRSSVDARLSTLPH